MASSSNVLKLPAGGTLEPVDKLPDDLHQIEPVIERPDGTIVYRVHPKQGLALASESTEQFFGGAAGGGKSHLMRVAGIHWACAIPGLQVYLFRRLYADLKTNHMGGPASFPVLLEPWIRRKLCKIIQGEIQFWNGSKIYLRHCQHENSLLKYYGAEIHLLLIDELTHWMESMYRFLRARMRVIGIKMPPQYAHLFPRALMAGNPGNVGHHWVKKAFVDHGTEIWRAPVEEGGALRQFIPSRLVDNPTLTLADPTYIDRLEGLGDPLLVRMLRDGDWDVVAGSMFGDVWRKYNAQGVPWHIVPGFDIPIGWDMWRGADDGFASPAACYWFAQDPDTKTIYVIDELYKSGMLPEAFAEEVLKRDRGIVCQMHDGTLFEYGSTLKGLMDSNAFSNTAQAVISRGEAMNKLGTRCVPVEKGPRSRVERAQHLHRLLAVNQADPHKRPGIQFFARCTEAIRTIPTLPRDKNDIEDVDTKSEDHAFDGVTYGLKWKRPTNTLVKLSGI